MADNNNFKDEAAALNFIDNQLGLDVEDENPGNELQEAELIDLFNQMEILPEFGDAIVEWLKSTLRTQLLGINVQQNLAKISNVLPGRCTRLQRPMSRSDRGNVYTYSSPLPGGVDDVMDRLGCTPTMEFDLLGKLD
ncbi:Uncharacterized protein Rs2_18005 [Raphanus sativus]|nr:Uncharacterized protein Rs2_18005 [Raphanus sativus]